VTDNATHLPRITIPPDRGAAMVIDVDAVVANYRLYREMAAPAPVAASLKADAYGLGIERLAPALAAAGCNIFFVALPCEGVALRKVLPRACIVVLSGADQHSAPLFIRNRLSPALNSLDQLAGWQQICAAGRDVEAAILHIDTGMSRLGLSPDEVAQLAAEPTRLNGVRLQCILSHLACADEPDNAMNGEQHAAFVAATAALQTATGHVARSIANSSGTFLGKDYHFDLVRPGAALYGINPVPHQPNPMKPAVSLYARILQVRDIDAPLTVGYGAAHRVSRPSRIATVAIGYADGYMRSVGALADSATAQSGAGNRTAIAKGYIGETPVPVVGRVSMDLITLDVSAVPPAEACIGSMVELIGPHVTLDELAGWAGTIGYEVLTGLGPRLARVYAGGAF
jgi:alanine racemase